MEKTFDGIVDGKHVQKWRLTDKEKVQLEARKAKRENYMHKEDYNA